ncbi:MAG: ABC transporter permease subunit [Calditrichaeota bacterium]|nr:ABC transporter permease subunit [Calditrichota bacterium]MCB9367902.1 ABC transporter permease subunit [Calditrichota bacterium]
MHNIMVIARREFKSYFDSPVAYIVLTFFLIITGYFFTSNLFLANQADLRTLWGIVPLLFVFFIPAISMRLLADEKKSGTIELLYTYPIKDSEIVVGKYLAALGLLGVVLVCTLFYAFTIASLGNIDTGQTVAGYVGLVLMAAAYLAIGVFASSVTDNQIVAFILALFISFFFFIADKILFFLPSGLAGVFEYLGIEYHFQNVARGVIDTRNLLYFASVIFFALLLASHALSRRRGD